MITIDTLSKLGDEYVLYVNCKNFNCCHAAPLDTAKLVESLGENFPLTNVGRKLRCGKCGGKDCGVKLVFNRGRVP